MQLDIAGPAVAAAADVTVVVVTYRGASWLPDCLSSLAAQTLPHQLLVIDNAWTDGTSEILRDRLRPDQVVRLASNTGFAGGISAALPLVRTRFLALLNDDAVAAPDWLAALMIAAELHVQAAAWTSLMLLAEDPHRVNNLGAALNQHWYGVDAAANSPVSDIDGSISDCFGFSAVPPCSAPQQSGRSVDSRRPILCTTRTWTHHGDCGWPGGRSGRCQARGSCIGTGPVRTHGPRCSTSTMSAIDC